MMKCYRYVLYGVIFFITSIHAYGQEQPYSLGKIAGFMQELRRQSKAPDPRGRVSSHLSLRVSDVKIFEGKINDRQSSDGEVEQLIGEIENVPGSSFYIRLESGLLDGNIVLRKSKKAYKYYSDLAGNAHVKEVDINEVLCVDFNDAPSATNNARAAAISPALLTLQSYPAGNGCVLLDFDGQYVAGTLWNNGNPINAAPATQTEAQMLEIWEMISEDFRPFHLNITTDETVFNTYPMNRRMRCIFTPTNTASPGAGGVAYVGSFNWNNDTPCWVFNGGSKAGGEAGSHEIGHTFGLGHDGRSTPAENYFYGHGNWAPIMGVGYNRAIVQWSKGEYTAANNKEDDLAKISSTTYGVGYRADDRGNTLTTATPVLYSATGSVSPTQNHGVVERTTDVDMYSFTTAGGAVTLNFTPATRHPNLDILATLYNSAGTVITTANPSAMAATISTTLAAGAYYISVAGTGAGNSASDGFSSYGSLGYYTISGSIPPAVASDAVATVYQHCSSTTGYAVGLDVGNYTTAQLAAKGVLNNDISSLKIRNGYEIVLYKSDNFLGPSAGFATDVACLTSHSLNDSTSSIRVRAVANQLPVVNIITPGTGAVLMEPASITIAANASDADGGISKVEFFNGGTRLGEATAAPYQFSWASVVSGTYAITVKATDDRGGESSAQVNVTVSQAGVTFYKDCNYNGYAITLAPGSYTLAALNAKGILNDDISALKAMPGYEVILYGDNNFLGGAYLFKGDFSCLVNLVVNGAAINLNDWASSLVVRESTSAAGAITTTSAVPTLEDADATLSLSVMPNPFVADVTVQYGNGKTLTVAVFTMDGYEIIRAQPMADGGKIDLSTLTSGVYLVKVSTDNGVIIRRIVKR